MPCYQTRTYLADFKGKDVNLIKQVMEALGFSAIEDCGIISGFNGIRSLVVDIGDGTVEAENSEDLVNFKMQYSKEVIAKSAKKTGWRVNWVKDNEAILTKVLWGN